MLLSHKTSKKNLYKILQSGYILPASITFQKELNPYDIDLKYIFTSCCPDTINIFDLTLLSYSIFFDANVIYDRVFYTNHHHSAGNISSSKKYPKNYKYIHRTLRSLYNHSMKIAHSIKMT